jgi:hypothetical protein
MRSVTFGLHGFGRRNEVATAGPVTILTPAPVATPAPAAPARAPFAFFAPVPASAPAPVPGKPVNYSKIAPKTRVNTLSMTK